MACLSTLRTWIDRSDLPTPSLTLGFDGSSGFEWDDGDSGMTRSADTTNYCYAPNNSQALKITNTSTLANIKQGFSSVDLTDNCGVIEAYFPAGSLNDENYPSYDGYFSGMSVFAHDSGGNYMRTTAANTNADIIEGWKSIPFNLGIVEATSGAFDITDVVAFTIQSNFTAATGNTITFDKLVCYPKATKGRVFVRFDDGWATNYTYAMVALAHGIKCQISVISDAIGTGSYMSLSQLQELHAAGCQILNHCTAGCISDTGGTLTGWRFTDSDADTLAAQANKITVIDACAAYLQANGMPEHAYTVVAPGGKTAPDDESLVSGNYCRAIVYGGAGHPMKTTNSNQVEAKGEHNWAIRGHHSLDDIDIAVAKSYVDNAVNDRGDLLFYGHNPAAGDTLNNFAEFCDYIKDYVVAGTLEVGSYSDLITPVGTTNLIQSGTGSIGGAAFGIGA